MRYEQTDTLVVGIVGDSWAAGRKADSLLATALSAAGIPCKIISAGHPGATSKQVYRNLFAPEGEQHSSQYVLHGSPRYCLVLCGVNDSNGQYGSGFYSHHTRLILRTLLAEYRADGIHLSAEGYRRLANAVARRIRRDLDADAE